MDKVHCLVVVAWCGEGHPAWEVVQMSFEGMLRHS